MLRGTANLSETLRGFEEGGWRQALAREGGQMASQAVPTFLSDIGGELDPYERRRRGFLDYIQGRTPIWREGLEARTDREGNPIRETRVMRRSRMSVPSVSSKQARINGLNSWNMRFDRVPVLDVLIRFLSHRFCQCLVR